jgi:hypothetical protein
MLNLFQKKAANTNFEIARQFLEIPQFLEMNTSERSLQILLLKTTPFPTLLEHLPTKNFDECSGRENSTGLPAFEFSQLAPQHT